MSIDSMVSPLDGGTDATLFRLLDLPAELQIIIYEFAVTEEDPIAPTAKKGTTSARLQPGITRVNRQIRQDALPLYYKLNSFTAFHGPQGGAIYLKRWLEAIGPDNRARITLDLDEVDCDKTYRKEYVMKHREIGWTALGGGRYIVRDFGGWSTKRVLNTWSMLEGFGVKLESGSTRGGEAGRKLLTFPKEKKGE